MPPTSYIRQYMDRVRSRIEQEDRYRLAVLGLVAIALVTGTGWTIAILYARHTTEAYDTAILSALWDSYKQQSWDTASGRSFDAQNHNVTTSEGQAYTMLRAVWMNDRPAFDLTWRWTAANLRRSDGLFSWRYGTQPDGTAGVLTSEGGENTASDADIDIATALLLAWNRWHSRPYRDAAVAIVPAIWNTEVVSVQGRPYLAADNLEKTATTASFLVNPSYLAPYAFRLFGKPDPQHDWLALANNAYTFWQHVDTAPLGSSAAGLPPDWVTVDRRTGAVQASASPAQTTDFGYNAFRVLWRAGLDWQWSHPPAVLQTFKTYSLLNRDWAQHHKLVAVYRHDGQPAVTYESLALYGGVLGYFKATDSSVADGIAASKLRSFYDQNRHQLAKPLDYYDNNWVWFGLALYNHRLSDFGQGGAA